MDSGRVSAPNPGHRNGRDEPPLGRVGRYELLAEIGRGGMGEVYKARVSGARGFEKQVVIKRILPHLAGDPAFVERFLDEGRLAVRLNHAGIAQVFDLGEDEGRFFIAMEFVDGVDLAELMRKLAQRSEKMPVAWVVQVLVALLDALDYAHEVRGDDGRPLGLVHRDVSPSNIMLSRSGEVKLLDFGIARAVEQMKSAMSVTVRGKFGYMSPQQAAGLAIDRRSDLFSLGVVAWELLAGQSLFVGASDLATLERVRTLSPPALQEVVTDLPSGLSDFVERLLEREPEARFQSAHEAAEVLRGVAAEARIQWSPRALASWLVEARVWGGSPSRASFDEVLAAGLPALPRKALTEEVHESPDAEARTLTPVERQPAYSYRGLGFALLVGLNLLLISVVVFLISQLSAKREAEEASMETRISAPIGTAGDGQTASEDVAESVIESPLWVAGSVFGQAVSELDLERFESLAEVVVRSVPAGAVLTIEGHGASVGPRRIKGRQGDVLHGRASLDGYESRAFEVRIGDEESVTVALKRVPLGEVRFRFFPADGTRVEIDGVRLEVGSNSVSKVLTVGMHVLVLEGADGGRLSRGFEVREGATTNLGTLEVR